MALQDQGAATVLLGGRDPRLHELVEALLGGGIVAVLARSRAELAALLRLHAGRAVAVLDVEDSEFGAEALELLHTPPACRPCCSSIARASPADWRRR